MQKASAANVDSWFWKKKAESNKSRSKFCNVYLFKSRYQVSQSNVYFVCRCSALLNYSISWLTFRFPFLLLYLFCSFSFVRHVLFVTGNANNETLFYMHVQPDRPDELERIEAAGGQVVYWHGPRVLGVLAMSRSIGTMMPPFVLCIWVISCEPRGQLAAYILLARVSTVTMAAASVRKNNEHCLDNV